MPYSAPHTTTPTPPPLSSFNDNRAPSPTSTEPTDLSDSFILVSSSSDEDDHTETESTSTVSTALLADLSDTSSEPRHPGSLEGSFHGNLSDVDGDIDTISERDLDGSYTDAEATESLVTDSRATLSVGDDMTPLSTSVALPSTVRGSQFAFIFPHLEASISSSGTYTDSTTTPSGSLANLLPPTVGKPVGVNSVEEKEIPKRVEREKSSGRVDEGWLKDARTWSTSTVHPVRQVNDVGKIELNMPSWDKGDYQALASVDSSIAPEQALVTTPKKELFLPIEKRQQRLKQALEGLVQKGMSMSSANKRWGLIAFASCALAILGAFGPNVIPLFTSNDSVTNINGTTSRSPVGSAAESAHTGLFSRTSGSTLPCSSTTLTPRSLATQLIPDLQNIRDAISTFTFTSTSCKHDANSGSGQDDRDTQKERDTATVSWRKRKSATTSTSCCTSSSAQNSVALTVRNTGKGSLLVINDTGYKAWMKAMANKVVRPTDSDTVPPDPAKSSCNCNTSSSALSPSPITHRYIYLLQRSRDYALATTSAFAQLYQPMLLHLNQEIGELYRLANYISTRAPSRETVRALRSVRQGAIKAYASLVTSCEWQRERDIARMRRAMSYVSKTFSIMADKLYQLRAEEQEHLNVMVGEAKDGLEKVSAMLAGKTGEAKIEADRSIRQAKKGLDRLIRNNGAKSALQEKGIEKGAQVGEKREEVRQIPTSWGHRIGTRRETRGRARRTTGCTHGDHRAGRANEEGQSAIRVEHKGRTKWRRLLDAVHHGAVQVVLH